MSGLLARLKRIERDLHKKKGNKTYVCFEDSKKNLLKINELGFEGTILEGNSLMKKIEAVSLAEVNFIIFEEPLTD